MRINKIKKVKVIPEQKVNKANNRVIFQQRKVVAKTIVSRNKRRKNNLKINTESNKNRFNFVK